MVKHTKVNVKLSDSQIKKLKNAVEKKKKNRNNFKNNFENF